MSNPRIEEVSDSDSGSDPEIDDPIDFLPNEVMRPANAVRAPIASMPSSSNPSLTPPTQIPSAASVPSETETRARQAEIKPYVTLYPVYFSSTRTRAQGRRVGKSLASPNPLAFNVLKAARTVAGSDLRLAFEPDKTHPKDWANPGRVKIELFDTETHAPLHDTIKNKQRLFNLVAQHLKDNPTQKEDPLDLKLQGLPVPDKFLETEIAIPRGWQSMNTILPVHSAAVSGGGVSDNFFKDAMEEMRQAQAGGGGADGGMGGLASMMQGLGGMGGMGGLGGPPERDASPAAGKKKKDKKKG